MKDKMRKKGKESKKKAPVDTVLEVQDGLIDINLLIRHIDKGLEENNGKTS